MHKILSLPVAKGRIGLNEDTINKLIKNYVEDKSSCDGGPVPIERLNLLLDSLTHTIEQNSSQKYIIDLYRSIENEMGLMNTEGLDYKGSMLGIQINQKTELAFLLDIIEYLCDEED